MSDKIGLYFLAILPPESVSREINDIREYVKVTYSTKAALRSPPHVTLHMPFSWSEKKEERLIKKLRQFSSIQEFFTLALRDFGCFDPRVIFICVDETLTLADLQKKLDRFCKVELGLFNANYKDLPFHPHLTIAFRDLKKEMFAKAWEEFRTKSFRADFDASNLVLLKHAHSRWEVFMRFPFAVHGK
jgi:2'-5' RNA ligase